MSGERALRYLESVGHELSRRGAYEALDYRPVFRASALFYCVADADLETVVTFMNYWREKNGNPHVSCLVSLRDAEGALVARRFLRLEDQVYQLGARALLGSPGPFEGSLELEFHSTDDLKFAVPAVQVFYVAPDRASCVHANQRTFNDLPDAARLGALNASQTGFDVVADDEASGFVAVVNGPVAIPEGRVDLELVNAGGEALRAGVDLGPFPAYGTRVVTLDAVPGAREHLGGRPGFCRVDATTAGTFDRFLCGVRGRERPYLAVTHSYYDCRASEDFVDPAALPADELGAFLPLVIPEGLEAELVFYPIFAHAAMRFHVDTHGPDGARVARLEDVARIDSRTEEMARLDLGAILRGAGHEVHGRLHCVVAEPIGEDRLPARLTFGLNFRGRDGGTPSNINASIYLNPGYGVRQRSYLWGPLLPLPGGRALAMVTYLRKQVGATGSAAVKITVHDRGGPRATRELELASGTGAVLDLAELLGDGAEVEPGRAYWFTLESPDPSVTAYHLSVAPGGHVAADHSF